MIAVMDPTHDVLKAEAAELNNYVRVMIQTSLAFFAFFGTATFTVLAVSLKFTFENKTGPTFGPAVYVVDALLALQSILSFIGIWRVRADVQRANRRIEEIQMAIAEGKSLLPRSPVPQSIEGALRLMAISLVSFFIITLFVIVAVRSVPT